MGGLTLDEHMMRRGLEIHAKANERERPTDAAKRLRRAIREKRAARPTKKPVDQIIRDELRQKKREARAERRRARGLDDDDASSVSSFASVASSSAASSCSFVPSEAAGPRRGGTARRSHDDLDGYMDARRGLASQGGASRSNRGSKDDLELRRRGEGGGGAILPALVGAREAARATAAAAAGMLGGRRRRRRRASGKEVVLADAHAREAADGLGLSQSQLKTLRAAFEAIDLDGSGSIEAEELLARVGEAKSPITDALFELIDVDGNGRVSFEEFVGVLATYCMYTQDDILQFVFRIFDKDGSGALNETEFIALAAAVNRGQPAFPGNFKSALAQFDVNDDGVIDFAEFRALHKQFPLILYPAFRLQDAMQAATLGRAQWKKILEAYVRQQRDDAWSSAHFGKKRDPLWYEKGFVRDVRRSLGLVHTGRVDVGYVDSQRPRKQAIKEERSAAPATATAPGTATLPAVAVR